MIDVKDLKVRDFVYYKDDNHFYSIRALCEDRIHPINIVEHDGNIRYAIDCGLDDLKPIPLTPELLFKHGFMQVNNNFILPNGFTVKMVLIESTDEIGLTVKPNGFIVSVGFSIKPFQYLHQLQNIYYDLMQTEFP